MNIIRAKCAITMRLGARRMSAPAILIVGSLSAALAGGQARGDIRPAEQVFKNVQALKGIPVGEFLETMGFFSASLGISCVDCHGADSAGDWAKYADDNDRKRRARGMIAMVNTMNKNFFAGRRVLTCYTCHRGSSPPETTPDLAQFYANLHSREPDQMIQAFPGAPAAEEVLDKYIRVIGGAQRAAGLTSVAAKGTYQPYATPTKYQFELFAKSPAQRTTIVHNYGGADNVTTYDGRAGWTVAPRDLSPLPVLEMTAGELDGAKLDAMLSFPAQIKGMLRDWRVGPPSTIDDRDVTLVQGTFDGRTPVNLYFDDESGLLIRSVRFSDSPVGLAPTQVDYSDYREVSGVKMPFKMIVTWLDGRSTIQLTEVQANVAIDAAKFTLPAAR